MADDHQPDVIQEEENEENAEEDKIPEFTITEELTEDAEALKNELNKIVVHPPSTDFSYVSDMSDTDTICCIYLPT